MKTAKLLGMCDCGTTTSHKVNNAFVCTDCQAAHQRASELGLLNDRPRRRADEGNNKEYATRYAKAYYKHKHLPNVERCAIARAEAAVPLTDIEAAAAVRLCSCGYPAKDGSDKCVVCEKIKI